MNPSTEHTLKAIIDAHVLDHMNLLGYTPPPLTSYPLENLLQALHASRDPAPEPTPEMTLERAREINELCTAHAFRNLGFDHVEITPLDNLSLQEMLKAARMIQEANENAPSINGTRTIESFCDTRLLAALYTLYHHPGNQGDTPAAVAGDRALFILRTDNTEPPPRMQWPPESPWDDALLAACYAAGSYPVSSTDPISPICSTPGKIATVLPWPPVMYTPSPTAEELRQVQEIRDGLRPSLPEEVSEEDSFLENPDLDFGSSGYEDEER